MTEQLNETKRPMTKRILKRICVALVVLLVASAVMVGAGSADATYYVNSTAQDGTGDGSESNPYSLNDAIDKSNSNDPTTIILDDGDYTMPNALGNAKEIVFTGSKSAVINIPEIAYADEATNRGSFSFDGVTVKFPDTTDYIGLAHITNLTYESCNVIGKQCFYAENVGFTNCILENKNDYCVWTWAASSGNNNKVIFNDCTFNTGGKAINVYNGATTSSYETTVELTRCVFNDDGTLNTVKAAVETGSDGGNTATSNKYYITFNDCTVNGFAINDEGTCTDTVFYGNKNSMDIDHLFVTLKHKVTWENHDGAVLESDEVAHRGNPQYNGATPTKPADDTYKYEFIGWNPDLQPVTNSITYTAQFKAIEIPPKDDDSASQGSSVWLTGPAYSIYTSHVENGGSAYFSENSPIFKVTMPDTYTGDVTITTHSDAESPAGKNVHFKADIKVEPAMSFGDIATIHFKLPLLLIQQNGFEAADVCLYHGNGDWTKLPTQYTIVGDTVYYESQTDSFSPFAIIFEENVATPKDAPSTPAPTETTSPGFGVLAVMAGLGAVAVLRRR